MVKILLMKSIAIKASLLVAAIIICTNTSCVDLAEDDTLTMSKRSYNGNNLKLDGYYHRITESGNEQVYFLYHNGIILHGGDIPASDLAEYEQMFKNGQFYELAKDDKTDWGVFHIDDAAIKFERLYPGDAIWEAYIRSGEILNDTTFHISQSQRSDGTEQRDKDETYRFKQFSPKPDSVVSFIP